MKRYISIIVTLFVTWGTSAQEDLSKQLEVTRQYTPRVARAEKLPIKPDMTDTVRLRPEISYSITSTASDTSFDTRPYEAATVSTASFERQKPLYIRAGAGAPLNTVFDLYFTPRMRTGSTFGLFANHSGSFSKLTNDIGVKSPATEMSNGIGVWGSRRWKRYTLKGDLTYDNRRYDLYGYAADFRSDQNVPFELERAKWSRAGGRIGFGDDFSDLSRLNFHVGLDGGYTHLGGHPGNFTEAILPQEPSQVDVGLALRMGTMFRDRQGFYAELKARYGETYVDYVTDDEMQVSNNPFGEVSFAPRYILEFEKFHLRVGGDMFYIKSRHFGQDRVRVFPAAAVSFDIADDRFVPFASLSSRIMDGSMEALSRRNPYINQDGATGLATDLKGGIEGDFGDVFYYKISVGASLFEDYNVMAPAFTLLAPIMFYAEATEGSQFTAGIKLGLQNLGGFSAKLHGNWYRNKFEKIPVYVISEWVETNATWLPDFDAGAVLSYSYKDKFSVSAGADFTGRREYFYPVYTDGQLTPEVRSISPVADLFLGAEVKVSRDFWVWVEGRNLANQALYPQPYYRGLGVGVMGGVKMVF